MNLPLIKRSGFTSTACTFNRWTRNSLRKLKKANLEALAQERKLNKKGTKDELVARLMAWQENDRRSTQATSQSAASEHQSKVSIKPALPALSEVDSSNPNTGVKSTRDAVIENRPVNSDKEQPPSEPVSSPATIASEANEFRSDEQAKGSGNKVYQSQKVEVVKRMSDFLEEKLPEHDNSVVDINYEIQTDETLLPQNWIQAFEMKVNNRSNRVSGKKATMTFKTREPRTISSNTWGNVTVPKSAAKPSTSDPVFENDFDRQWVDAFDRKVAQRGSRRLLELASQDYDSKIANRPTGGEITPDITKLTAALNDNMTMTKAKYAQQPNIQISARSFLQRLALTPIAEISIEKLCTLAQSQKGEDDSGKRHQSQHDNNNEQSNRMDGNQFATTALGVTMLIWLIYGQDGVQKTVSSMKRLGRSKSSES
ncbi:hypothetical protein VKS41_000272 [Umbelopsis sp. WA50703]